MVVRFSILFHLLAVHVRTDKAQLAEGSVCNTRGIEKLWCNSVENQMAVWISP